MRRDTVALFMALTSVAVLGLVILNPSVLTQFAGAVGSTLSGGLKVARG